MFLAFDTSTEWCSVAVGEDRELVFTSKRSGQEHSKQLLAMVDAMLAQQNCSLGQMKAIIFGAGPGSFTGLRIACGVAQGLAYGANLPVVGVSTLEVLAQRWRFGGNAHEPVLALFDARMGQFYGQLFDTEFAQFAGPGERLTGPFVLDLEDLIEPLQAWLSYRKLSQKKSPLKLVGNAWSQAGLHIEQLLQLLDCAVNDMNQVDAQSYPRADWLLTLGQKAFERGEFCDAAQASPIYIRNDVALNKAGQQALREKNQKGQP